MTGGTLTSGSLAAQRVPLTILTGFLGAGKTTLLRRILTGAHGLRMALLVNDFGAINIDADLVVGVDEREVVSLGNGCVCCTIRDDLIEAVERVMARPDPPDHVVLEASGIADPASIAVTFLDSGRRDRFRIDSITCVIDAAQAFATPEHEHLKLWQIGCADMLVLNKADLVDADQITRIRSWLDEHFHRYRLIEATQGDVPLELLMASGQFDPAAWESPVSDHSRHQAPDPPPERGFAKWSYESEEPMSLRLLEKAAATLPSSVYRCKGIVSCAESPDVRVALQVVGKRVDVTELGDWGARLPSTRLVVIGAEGAVDGDALQVVFDGCRAERR